MGLREQLASTLGLRRARSLRGGAPQPTRSPSEVEPVAGGDGGVAADRSRKAGGGGSRRFEAALERQAEERHARLLDPLVGGMAQVRPYPPGFRAQDALGRPLLAGFLPVAEAAQAMSVDEEEVVALATAGRLEARHDGVQLYVRPAIVTVLGVRRDEGKAITASDGAAT